MDKLFHRSVEGAYSLSVVPFIFLLLVTGGDVIARYVFNTSFFDAMTLSTMSLAVITWLALPHVTDSREHVSVSILTSRVSARTRSVLDIISSIVACLLFMLISWMGAVRAIYSYQSGEFEGSMEIPVYPIKFVFTLGAILTLLTFFAIIIQEIKNLSDGEQ